MACNCMVIVREVWDTRDLVGNVLDESGAIRSSALQTRFEPEDLNALEAALRLKDAQGGTVTAVTVGAPRGGVEVLRECLYRGADATLQVEADPTALDDRALAVLLAGAIRKVGADLALVGTSVVDGENALLGALLAVELGWDHVAWVDAIESVADGKAVAKRAIEMGYEFVETPLPSVLSIGVALLEDDPRAPRSAKAMLKLKMKKAAIPTATPADLGVSDPAALVTTRVASRAPVPPRVVETKTVDAENAAALRAMMDEVLKGK